MLCRTGTGAPQSSRMDPPGQDDTALSDEAGTYLKADNQSERDDCQASVPRSVISVQTSNLLALADPAIPDSEGNTPLCLAAQSGNLVQAQQLILRGADVHHINLDGDNALTLAAAGGYLSFIEWLDSHCPQPVNHENYYAETALTLAARHGHQPLVQWLVSRDASVLHLNDQHKDALAEAVANGHLELAQWLAAQNTDFRRVYPDGNNLFLHAVRAGRQDIAQWLEDSGVDSQQINESGGSAITLAARYGHHQLLARLLAKDAAGTRQICRNGDSPLLIAARHGHGETVKLLMQHGADIGHVNYADNSVLTLAATSNESLALWLCDAGAYIHHIELSGNNAFTLAAQSGFFQLMQTLEQLGIDIHQVNHDNDNAFTLVARQGSLPWCQWLAGKGINIHQVNRSHHNAVTLAALAGSLPLLRWLGTESVDLQQIPKLPPEDQANDNGWVYGLNAAILAAGAGHFTEAQWLMQQGLSIHQRDYYNRNAVIHAVRLGQLEAVQWLTARGIIPDSFPNGLSDEFKKYGCNAMRMAVQFGHLHILQWLHQNGGSLDQSNSLSLLRLAIRIGHLPITEWLCRHGADVKQRSELNEGVLSSAVRWGYLRLSQWLDGQGAEDIPDFFGFDALTLAAQGGHNAIFRWLIRSESLNNQQGNHLLLRALYCGNRSLAVWLCLNVCHSISGADEGNCNALMLAAKHGFLWLTQWLSEKTTVDINQACHRGYTALMLAAQRGHLPVVQWLYLEKNANLHQKCLDNGDALHLAIYYGHTDTARWLIGQGMALNLDYFKWNTVRWISNRNNFGLLHYLLRQRLSPSLLGTVMLDAACRSDVATLICCFRGGVSPRFSNTHHESCFAAAAVKGSLATLEFLRRCVGDAGVNNATKSCLKTAAKYGNLHVIQWFWGRRRPSIDEQYVCLLNASFYDHLHVVKWLHRQGVKIGTKSVEGHSGLSAAAIVGNIPMLEWFCQQGEDLFQVRANGKGALSLAIANTKPQAAIWLFRRGLQLSKSDFKYAFGNQGRQDQVLSMILNMTSRSCRATLFHASGLNEKLRILTMLGRLRSNERLSEAEADASFARFNQYNDQKLEHKCLVALANIIKQQSGTAEAGFKVVDSLPIAPVCKCNLREMVSMNFVNFEQ